MSTLKVLKEYLLGDGGYLLNDDNNGKTVMISGAWGSGKTHFWQNEIENDLTEKLKNKNKACVYVSLYGKDNIEAIKNEILFKAYESIKNENKLAKRAISAFGFSSRLLSVSIAGVRANTGAVGDAVEGFFESKKIDEAESFLADGGLVCLDDFERKSKHIDLNDLFGFISQLAIDMNCKIVIILNSDVFEGEEANVFKTVKEKTVNKFFYFEPTIEELFNFIYKKYQALDDYRTEILKTIKETEELNARIYIQVLDNCLEWVNKKDDTSALRCLVLNTICFVKYDFTLSYPIEIKIREVNASHTNSAIAHDEFRSTSLIGMYIVENFLKKGLNSKILIQSKIDSFYDGIIPYIGNKKISEEEKTMMIAELNESREDYIAKLTFAYKLQTAKDIDKNLYLRVSRFVETGIYLEIDEKSS